MSELVGKFLAAIFILCLAMTLICSAMAARVLLELHRFRTDRERPGD